MQTDNHLIKGGYLWIFSYRFFWLAALVVFLVFEIITLGLTSIWFAGGALAAFVAAEFGANPIIQSLAFLIVSLLLLLR